MAEMDNYEKMSQEQGLWSATGDGAEYVVRGAVVGCSKGSSSCVLNLPTDYGLFTSEGRSKILSKDTKTANIKGFGTCGKGKNQKKCTPKLSDWQYVDENDKVEINGVTYYAVSKNAKAQCSNGDGTVEILKSGQADPDGKFIDIDKFTNIITINNEIQLEKYVNQNSATVANPSNATSINEENTNDIFGIIQVEKTGVYTITISTASATTDDPSVLKGMVLYAYKKTGSGLKYMQAYPMDFYNDSLFYASLDWFIDINEEYYFELDWSYKAGVKLKCKLVPFSLEISRTLLTEEHGLYWGIDEKFFNSIVANGWACIHLQTTFDGTILINQFYIDSKAEENLADKISYYLKAEERNRSKVEEVTIATLNTVPTALGLLAYLATGSFAAVLSAVSMAGSVLCIILTYGKELSSVERFLNALIDWDDKNGKRGVPCKISAQSQILWD